MGFIPDEGAESAAAEPKGGDGSLRAWVEWVTASWWRTGGLLAVAIPLVALVVFTDLMRLPGASMAPGYPAGSFALTVPTTAPPQRGQVVVFDHPQDPGTQHLKRVIGLPGEVIEGRRGELWINGQPARRTAFGPGVVGSARCMQQRVEFFVESIDGVSWPVLKQGGHGAYSTFGPLEVRAGHLFVTGDHRDASSDSRAWGQVPIDNVTHTVVAAWGGSCPEQHPDAWAPSLR